MYKEDSLEKGHVPHAGGRGSRSHRELRRRRSWPNKLWLLGDIVHELIRALVIVHRTMSGSTLKVVASAGLSSASEVLRNPWLRLLILLRRCEWPFRCDLSCPAEPS